MFPQLYVATRKGLFAFERAGAGPWRIACVSFLGHSVTTFLHDSRGGVFYAGLRLGHFGCKLHRSSDGHTWSECTAPPYPPQPAPANGNVDPHPWRLERIWCLEVDHESQNLWAGTIPGGLFRSADRGDSWEFVWSLWNRPERRGWFGGGYDYPGIHSICIDPRDSRQIIVGVSVGGVWRTKDLGQTWEPCAEGMLAEYMPPEKQDDQNSQDPHRVVQCPAAPDWLWAQHHNGIYRSRDNAVSWESIGEAGPSTFGFAVAVHPSDPRTAWFAPAVADQCRIPVDAQMVVTRTRDGGTSFAVLGKGLPSEQAYDLVYRHCLALSSDGKLLALASTTGNLWVSDDEGDSWTTVSCNLPPIYGVRFEA